MRTLLLVRAWAVQRCQSSPWASESPWRAREFAVETARLMRDVAALKEEDGLLGDNEASKLFVKWLPDAAASLRTAAAA